MGPRLPVRCRLHARTGLSVGAARPFGLWSHARLHGCPQSGGVTRPRSLFYVALLRRGSRPGRAGTSRRWDLRRGAPLRLRLTVLRRRRKTVALRACAPLRLRPSMAMDDLRLALPCELYRLLSDAFGFLRRHRSTVGAAHREKHNAKACARIGDERLIPAIHRAVATLGCAGRGKWRVPDRASFGDQYRYAKSSREGFPRVFSRRIGGS